MAAPSQVEDFEPHVGKTFHFTASGHALTLQRVDSDRAAPAGMRKPFILVFTGPPGPGYMREGLLECLIEDGQPFQIYVSPVQTFAADHQEYQAVFN